MDQNPFEAPIASVDQPMAKAFSEFPLGVRVAQRSLIAAIAIPLCLRSVLRGKMPRVAIAIGMASGMCALVGLVATFYVVIRYPYIGMLDAIDGDLYSKYIGNTSKLVLRILAVAGILLTIAIMIVPALDNKISGQDIVIMVYCASILCFLLFLVFYYDRMDYPAVATFLRCSLGIGIPLVPLFLPALVYGSYRAAKLLEQVDRELEIDDRQIVR